MSFNVYQENENAVEECNRFSAMLMNTFGLNKNVHKRYGTTLWMLMLFLLLLNYFFFFVILILVDAFTFGHNFVPSHHKIPFIWLIQKCTFVKWVRLIALSDQRVIKIIFIGVWSGVYSLRKWSEVFFLVWFCGLQ